MINFKVVLLGDCNVGKTALLNRFMDNTFEETSNTLGVNFLSKVMGVKDGSSGNTTKVKL